MSGEGLSDVEMDAVTETLAKVLAGSHRKLRYGTKHDLAGEPNDLAFSVARGLVTSGLVNFKVTP